MEAIRDAVNEHMRRGRCPKRITLVLNEKDPAKHSELKLMSQEMRGKIPNFEIECQSNPFAGAFALWADTIMRRDTACFVLLDQFGISEVKQEIFYTLTCAPRTDFMFFISSSSVNRFKEHPNIKRHIPEISRELRDAMTNETAHKVLCDSYRSWLPQPDKYYLGHFSLKKDAGNVNGLIFGSAHPLGIQKFLEAAWRLDKLCGDSNYSYKSEGIDPRCPSMFPEMDVPTKITLFKKLLREKIIAGELTTGVDAYDFSLRNGMLARHAQEELQVMQREGVMPKQRVSVSYDAWNKGKVEPLMP